MKKKYMMPAMRAVELSESDIICGSITGDPVDGDGLDNSGTGQGDGEDAAAKAQRNMWDNQW